MDQKFFAIVAIKVVVVGWAAATGMIGAGPSVRGGHYRLQPSQLAHVYQPAATTILSELELDSSH